MTEVAIQCWLSTNLKERQKKRLLGAHVKSSGFQRRNLKLKCCLTAQPAYSDLLVLKRPR